MSDGHSDLARSTKKFLAMEAEQRRLRLDSELQKINKNTKQSSTSRVAISCTCEVCGRTWKAVPSLATRTCSHKCGAKLNPSACRDVSKWHTVKCESCGKQFERRKRQQPKHTFCSHACKSKGAHIWCGDSDRKHMHGNRLAGYYTTRDGRMCRYDSSYELRRMKELDYVEQGIKTWSRCDFSIPWNDAEGKLHHYHPDLLVTLADDTKVIEEMKGVMQDSDVRKMMAAVPYAKERGWKYRIVQYDNVPDDPLPKMKPYTNEYGTFVRPSEETIFMKMATILSARATCLRKKVSAVFTDAAMHRVLCFGYNGNVADGPNQCDALLEGACGCTHAEVNALTQSISSLAGATCFVTLSPCLACAKVLVNRGIKRVVYYETYRNASGLTLLREHGVTVEKYDNLQEVTSVNDATLSRDLVDLEHPCCEVVKSVLRT